MAGRCECARRPRGRLFAQLEQGEVLEKTGDTFTIKLTKTIDDPIDKVWRELPASEELEKYSEQYQQTKLVKSEGNTTVVDYRVSARSGR